jgi:predicted kinase
MKPKAFITVGIPGSGKTYWVSQAVLNGGVNINLDDCRLAVSGDASNQECTPQAVALHTALIDAVCSQKCTLYVSDTNLHPEFRAALIAKLEAVGYEVVLVVFNTPHQISRARNAIRSNPVPSFAMNRMEEAFETFMQSATQSNTLVLV